MNFSNAINYCNNLNKWWYKDWRVPNIWELESIVNISKIGLTEWPFYENYFTMNNWYFFYWSSSNDRWLKDNYGNEFVWWVYFNDGLTWGYSKYNIARTICVSWK